MAWNSAVLKVDGNKVVRLKTDNVPTLLVPENVTEIGARAFTWSRSLTSITLPESLTNIGYTPPTLILTLTVTN